MISIYYSTKDIERIFKIDESFSKIIAGKAAQVILNFGEKEAGAWRFNFREAAFIKHVKDYTAIYNKEFAFRTALGIFYQIDCSRLDISGILKGENAGDIL